MSEKYHHIHSILIALKEQIETEKISFSEEFIERLEKLCNEAGKESEIMLLLKNAKEKDN